VSAHRLELFAPSGVPLIEAGADLAATILAALCENGERLLPGDIVVIAQKIVSKAENQYVRLADVEPSLGARTLAERAEKDPRLVELILRESRVVLRCRSGVIVVEHRLGFVIANAGIDASNAALEGEKQRVLLLPKSPDASAAAIRGRLEAACGNPIGVIINDTVGRAWRNGAIGTCLGNAGVPALQDLRGSPDLFGRPLMVSTVGLSDEIAAAASLLQGQANEGRPVVVARGYSWQPTDQTGRNLIRARDEDMFR
jgi:coenzyme F420-0:L-glutamate ligase / coenzyme F420-1:gamma-L-glutamate ligase